MAEPLWVMRMVLEQFHRDVEGRPIREGRTPGEFLRAGEIEYKQCPFPGSRYLHANPMNVSALYQTSAHWDEIVDTMAFLRSIYTRARGGYGPDTLDLWRVSQLGSALPWFHILRGETAPAYAAALSKAMLGVGIWGQRVFVKTFIDRWLPPPAFTTAQIIELAESTDTLIAETEVCSASEKMMIKFFDVLTLDPSSALGSPEACPLAARGDDVLRFGAHYLAFKQWLYMYYLARRFLYRDVEGVAPSAELGELLGATCEPPDFFMVEPGHLAAVPLEARAAWFRGLAELIVPIAPDQSDAALRDAGMRLAAAMGDASPPRVDEIAAELVVPDARGAARAIATFVVLDEILADVVGEVETAFRRSAGAAPYTGTVDAASRDRLLAISPRLVFQSLAPRILGETG